ncbi:MAG: KH domain-containing protein [Clostridia bacterium]|nr:KH domain-containing protein [Clostridia bacterium]
MDKLVEFIAKSLVDHPENVRVTTREEDDSVIIELVVDPEDTGKVIGKQGRIAKAIRAIVKAASINDEKKVVVDIL